MLINKGVLINTDRARRSVGVVTMTTPRMATAAKKQYIWTRSRTRGGMRQ